ncbi:hypothetical protein CMV_013712 [Castanea mollissima]|uniref:Uncharacterized protein n=1 Tax=Castanea mollissima TaxID=60419 RepID=A0A8J4RCK9_9ROSI|nr:hypothetical protein CMV_013712 [Castanea mollissima]
MRMLRGREANGVEDMAEKKKEQMGSDKDSNFILCLISRRNQVISSNNKRYRDTISNRNSLGGREGSGLSSGRESATDQCRLGRPSVAGDWQIIIKIVNSRSRKFHRYGTVYEGLTVQGEKVFFGAISSTA